MHVSGFESYRPSFEMTWTTGQPSAPREEAAVQAETKRHAAQDTDRSATVLQELAAYQFAQRVNDRALGVLQPIE